MSAEERLLTPDELGRVLGVPLSTLYGWRTKGYGPKGIRVGRHVRYRRTDVDAWIAAQAEDA